MKRGNLKQGLAISLLCVTVSLSHGAAAQQSKSAPTPSPPAAAAGAGSGVFRCVDADGRTEYRNVGDTKGCKRVETDSVNTVPFPRAASAPSTQPRGNTRVDAGAQRGRDNDRRRILEDELASEEKRLADLRQEFNNGEPERRGDERNYQRYLDRVERLKADIARSEANVESLKRELGSARN